MAGEGVKQPGKGLKRPGKYSYCPETPWKAIVTAYKAFAKV
jgi:hypothetical protein